eukprot:4338822-Alexandrium_andersonii.AAC.1
MAMSLRWTSRGPRARSRSACWWSRRRHRGASSSASQDCCDAHGPRHGSSPCWPSPSSSPRRRAA